MALADPSAELPTLLHHAAAGPAQDRRLVEWLIQIGALTLESNHCRVPSNALLPEELAYALAVHCAVKQGYNDIVKLIIGASNLRDLDTRTFRTNESLVHLAVKTGNLLFDWLVLNGASVSSCEKLWYLTSDPSFKAAILDVTKHNGMMESIPLQFKIDSSRMQHSTGRSQAINAVLTAHGALGPSPDTMELAKNPHGNAKQRNKHKQNKKKKPSSK